MPLSLVASLAVLASAGAPCDLASLDAAARPVPAAHVPAPLPTVVVPMFFSEIVAQSELIVVGTAAASTSRHEEGGKTIRTYVTFQDLAVQKGRVDGASLVLRLEGGAVGDDRLVVAGMPQFTVGSRYLLYVSGNGTSLSPITGFNQGAFEIVRQDGREVLRNLRGEELIGIRQDRFVFAAKPVPVGHRRAGMPAAAPAPAAVAVPFEPVVQPADPDLDRREREMVARQRAGAAGASLERAPEPTGVVPAPAVAASTPPVQATAGVTPAAVAAPVTASDTRAARDARPILVPQSQDRGERIDLRTMLETR